MENNLFLDSSKVILTWPPAVNMLFYISVHFHVPSTIFLGVCLSLSIPQSSNSFGLVHLIKLKESSMTGPTAAMSGGDLCIKLIEFL